MKDPKGLHDAVRKAQELLAQAEYDLTVYMGSDDGRYDELSGALRNIRKVRDTVMWVRDTFESGQRRQS